MIDKITLDQCIRKDRKAFKQCYEVCAPYVYTIVKNYIHNPDERQDAMQEIFAEIFSSLKNYDSNKGTFKSWISSIAIYKSIGLIRKKKKVNIYIPLEEVHDISGVENDLDSLNQKELNNLFEKMPEGYRTVFLLSVIDEYSHNEIATMMGCSPENSRSQLSRALNWIRKNIKQDVKKYLYGTV